ncbi:DSBA oxidoreductase [Ureibacillus massiliensis 4400831 = CIP 108448 = CCUG 49529]|uniref:DSBA oxidoreductase n=1 Tax=Ureibacillus massiliensis 4400831 = CIP 108448 = CCUG 49529 TaxID=1211035 RepID=A0A0A3J475_9BACL|nr:DsbA family oxidoreductase [Ureibacillus massiliensis]KGR91804.1 DSBA oxidoreductase [Ureibacillus massiliensis 4400831 = CIP 108448 = CCUG 49529]
MKVEVWSDYVCPFCYIGKRQLEKALKDTGYEGQIEVEYKSFLLDPTTPIDADESVYSSLAKKFGVSVDEAKNMTKNVANRAKEVGLEYDFDIMKTANTVAAHRLAKWADTKGKGSEMSERLLQAYFSEGQAIGKRDVLLKLVEELGLDTKEATDILEGEQYAKDVEQDIIEAQTLGVRGVPFFVFDNKYGISGAQPQPVFEKTIEKVASEAGLKPKLKMVGNDNGAICTDDHCDF